MKASKELVEFVDELCSHAYSIACHTQIDAGGNGTADSEEFNELVAGCRLLVKKLGPFGVVWDDMLEDPKNADVYYSKRFREF